LPRRDDEEGDELAEDEPESIPHPKGCIGCIEGRHRSEVRGGEG
jgi:hypothetical protein